MIHSEKDYIRMLLQAKSAMENIYQAAVYRADNENGICFDRLNADEKVLTVDFHYLGLTIDMIENMDLEDA
jgi:hypothetical protein